MSEWLPIETAPKTYEEIIILFDSASEDIVRLCYWHDGIDDSAEFNSETLEYIPNQSKIGWWSYKHSVTSEKMEGYLIPICWMPNPERPNVHIDYANRTAHSIPSTLP